MSTISDKISVKKPVIPEQTNVPLDARTVCDSVDDFPNIELPYLGMIVFTKSDGKYWKITELKEKQIGFISVANAQIAAYEEFGGNGTGTDTNYTEGDGIKIENGKISCTISYSAGKGIEITDKNVINCTVTPGNGTSYTAGENITISKDGVISAKDTKYSAGNGIEISAEGVISCTVSGGEYTAGDGLTLTGTSFAVDTNIIASREYVDGKIGNINSILDAINGEAI